MKAKWPATFLIAQAVLLCLSSSIVAKAEAPTGRAGNWHRATQGSPNLAQSRKEAEAQPNNAEVQNDYGWALRQHGHSEEAEPYLRKAETLDPSLAYVHSNLSVVCLDLDKKQEALEEAKKAVSLDKEQPIFQVVYGNAQLANGNTKSAIIAYKSAIHLRPDYENAFYNLARAFKENGQYTEAKIALSEAFKLDQRDDRILLLMDSIEPSLASQGK